MSTLTRADVQARIQKARDNGHQIDFSGEDLCGLDLSHRDLRDANLQGTDLRDADLRGAALRDANLQDALSIDHLPSGFLYLIPTPDGWHIQVGCWDGTPDGLRHLIAQNEGWPEATGAEITRRRPYLEAALALCEVHMADHTEVIDNLHAQWGSNEDEAA